MPPPPQPKIAFEDAFSMVATWRSFAFPVMGRAVLPPESAEQMVRALASYAKMIGERKLAEITLIAHDAPFPGAEARAALDAGVPLVSPYYGCVSAVFEGTGFRAALVRGIVTSFQMLSRTKYPQKVCSRIEEAARWSFPHVQAMGMTNISADEIAAAAHAVRDLAVARGLFEASPQLDASPST